jgi:serine/threonine protein kinase
MTAPEAVIGSPAYLAPELWQAQTPTPQTDLYSLGVMVYELLAGDSPFPNATPAELLHKHLHNPLPMIPRVPDAINTVIQTATAKAPADRYPDARSLAQAFRAALTVELTETDGIATAIATTALPDVPTAALDVDTSELRNPYKGLRAFQEADAQDSFGREALVDRLLALLNEDDDTARFLAVVGPSGSGKSSVVRAGLIPALCEDWLPGAAAWAITTMFARVNPFYELEAALQAIAVRHQPDLRRTDVVPRSATV